MKNYLWDMLTNIRNGQMIKSSFIVQKNKKICRSTLLVLWNEGFILGFKEFDKDKLKIFLKYKKDRPVINSIKSVSKPGKRIYFSVKQLWKIGVIKGTLIISTNKGLMTISECKKNNRGGEVFFLLE